MAPLTHKLSSGTTISSKSTKKRQELARTTNFFQKTKKDPTVNSTDIRLGDKGDFNNSNATLSAASACNSSSKKVDILSCSSLTNNIYETNNGCVSQDAGSRRHFQTFIESILLVNIQSTAKKTSMLLASREKIRVLVNEDYTDVLLDQFHSGICRIDAHLAAATHVLQEFINIQSLLSKHTNMALSLQEMVFSVIEKYIHPRVTEFFSMIGTDVSCFSPGDAADIITWIDGFLATVTSDCPHVRADDEWIVDCDRLVTFYMEFGVRRETKDVLKRLQQLGFNVRRDVKGHALSSTAEDIFFMIDSEIKVAEDKLPPRYTEQVLYVCNEELRNFVGDLMMKIGTDWKQLDSAWYCVLINDSLRLAELCEDRNKRYFVKTSYQSFGDQVSFELLELSLHAMAYLCERIMSDLSHPEPILTSIGDETWENDETNAVVERTVATLTDYFDDIERWLVGNYHFPKIIKMCFDLMLKIYVESFFANTLAHGVKNPAKVADKLSQDYRRLTLFFNGKNFERYNGAAGYYKPQVMNERLYIIQCLSKLINPKVSAEEALNEVKLIMRDFRETFDGGSPVIFHVVGLRKKHSGSESIEWLRAVSKVKKSDVINENPSSSMIKTQPQFYNIVDLRNSRYLHNVRPVQRDLQSKISVTSLTVTKTTTQMLLRSANPMQRRFASVISSYHPPFTHN